MTHYTLFTDLKRYYTNLKTTLETAESSIHMAYFAFDEGHWARQIAHVLSQKVKQGVPVHLMIDEAGLYLDNIRHAWLNRQLLACLQASGVQVDIFRPNGRRLRQSNRLHCKFCAIDGRVAFMGGSNIGDHYLDWRDSNLRIEGDLGHVFPTLYTGLQYFAAKTAEYPLALSQLQAGGTTLCLTLPHRRKDIRRALLKLILEAKKAIYLRTWYFLPDQEIVEALLSQAESGVQINLLFSDRTRIPLIDLANRLISYQLLCAGAQVYRYRGRYMHAKEAWNDQGDILFGSANIDRWALNSNFECSLWFHNTNLARHLEQVFRADMFHCQITTLDKKKFDIQNGCKKESLGK